METISSAPTAAFRCEHRTLHIKRRPIDRLEISRLHSIPRQEIRRMKNTRGAHSLITWMTRKSHGGDVGFLNIFGDILDAFLRLCQHLKKLTGGYESFHTEYPECCISQKALSQEENESDRNLRCEKLSSSFQKPSYDEGSPVEILPFLYLGSAYHASKCEFLANLRITALLNVSRKCSDCIKDKYDYKWIPVEDNHNTDISSHFQEAIEFIDTVRLAGGKVLVHCEAGISRSPTICMAYLMKTKRFRLEEAFEYIKQRRSLISPNFSFMGQLLHYETEIFSSITSAPPVSMSCKRDTVSFFAEEMDLGQHFEGSCFSFPASVLSPVPLRSPVHQLKLSPITATSSC